MGNSKAISQINNGTKCKLSHLLMGTLIIMAAVVLPNYSGIKSAEAATILAVAITSPPQDAHLTSGLVSIAGTSTPGANPISKVEVSMNDTAFNQATPKAPGDWSTWSVSINVPNIGPNGKTFAYFNARVTDSLGNTALSPPPAIRIFAYAPPSVAITSPANNAHVTAGLVMISGTAYSPKPIQFVDLSIDGNSNSYLRTTNTSGTWSTWSINYNIPSGSHWLVARVDDEMGRVAWNSVTLVGVTSTAPAVAITSPANNAHVTAGMVTFSGTASSGNPITKVELAIDGSAASYQLATSTSAGFATWSISYNIPVGSHWLVARVTDSAGGQAWNSITVVGS